MNYYELLEIPENASDQEIRAAYLAMVKKYHPDTFEGNAQFAQERTGMINEAYETLSDPQRRLEYDRQEGTDGRRIVQEQIRRFGEEVRAKQDAEDERKRQEQIRRYEEELLRQEQEENDALRRRQLRRLAIGLLAIAIVISIMVALVNIV